MSRWYRGLRAKKIQGQKQSFSFGISLPSQPLLTDTDGALEDVVVGSLSGGDLLGSHFESV